jgi:hypothetical protein
MKKILFTLLCLIPLIGLGQSQFKRGIMVGTTDSTAVIDSIAKYGDIFRVYSGADRIYDDKLLQDAYLINDIVPMWADTADIVATQTYVASMMGGGTAGKFYVLSGNVDDTGFPVAGDTSLTHTNFIGKHVTVIREGQIQQQHINNTTQDGFWLDNATGIIRFRPALSAGEQIEIWSTSTIQWETLVAEGGGGAAESTLLTSLRAGWKLDETSGTIANDVQDTYHGTTNAAVNQPGKFGVAETFTRASSHYISLGTTVGDVGVSDFSIAAWVYVSDTAKVECGIMGNAYGPTPYYYLEINEFDYRAKFYWNFGSGAQELDGNAFIPQAVWTHIAVTVDRSGNATMYINGVAQTDLEDVSGDVAVVGDNNTPFNIGNIGNNAIARFFNGSIDDAYIWLKVLTQDEITELQTATHPF